MFLFAVLGAASLIGFGILMYVMDYNAFGATPRENVLGLTQRDVREKYGEPNVVFTPEEVASFAAFLRERQLVVSEGHFSFREIWSFFLPLFLPPELSLQDTSIDIPIRYWASYQLPQYGDAAWIYEQDTKFDVFYFSKGITTDWYSLIPFSSTSTPP